MSHIEDYFIELDNLGSTNVGGFPVYAETKDDAIWQVTRQMQKYGYDANLVKGILWQDSGYYDLWGVDDESGEHWLIANTEEILQAERKEYSSIHPEHTDGNQQDR